MSTSLAKVSYAVLRNCLGLKAGENLLIVSDDDKKEIAEALYEAGKQLGAESMLFIMKERERSGEEPPAPVSAAMKEAYVAVCVTKHSPTYTKAGKYAVANGTRVATMPEITPDMFLEGPSP
ncbi:leucyl aminopeptidase (aminopeptidase T) [Geobacillus subterraneus]